MGNYEVAFDAEVEHLKQIIAIAEEQLNIMRKNSSRQQADLIEAKKELWENSSHSISNLWSQDRFYELVGLTQYASAVSGKLSALEVGANKVIALERMIQSPYFARIDFHFEGEQEAEQIYIGRSSLIDEKEVQLYVYDWRSPLASVFYRFGVGSAFYDAPDHRITGEVGLKRQFEIHESTLEYFFDADVQIMDEFLRKLLSQNASSKMKAIVETIQKDQDIIIRDMTNELMMVQGVAGSGKTSVALHRVAYLMYQGLSSKLSAHNVLIISPNTLFERYISNVLPELGEDNVASVNFDDLIKKMLPARPIQSRHQYLENLLSGEDEHNAQLMKRSLEFKASPAFKEILERFIVDIPKRWIPFSDIDYDGKCIASRTLLKEEILDRKRAIPLGLRLKHLEESIFETVQEMRKTRLKKLKKFAMRSEAHVYEVEAFARQLSIAESTVLAQEIEQFTTLDIYALYQALFADLPYFHRLAAGIQLPEDIDQILLLTQESMQGGPLPFADGLALAFLQLKLYGFRYDHAIKQVVIDEAQDYYPLHFELLKLLFPQARYTILGDIYQTIAKPEELSFFSQISTILEKKRSSLVTMNKSFRCTSEILKFSSKFLRQDAAIESFSRQGEAPLIHEAENREALDELIIKEVKFCKEADHQSIGLLCKTEKEALALYHRLQEHLEIRFIGSDTITDIKGTFVLPLYMAKGLEFDAVLLCDTDKAHYSAEDDKKLLYIGCTRALHRLSLFYTGEKSTLL